MLKIKIFPQKSMPIFKPSYAPSVLYTIMSFKAGNQIKVFWYHAHHFSFFKLDYSAILSAKCVCVCCVHHFYFEYAVISAYRFNM